MTTIQTVANATPASYAEYLYNLKTALLASGGWTLHGSSNGTSFDITGGTDYWSSAANINHNKAWIRLRSLNSSEIVFQTDASTGLRWKYSKGAQFSGGSPSATQVPSAADEVVVCGSGTDGSPGFDAVFGGSLGIQQVYVDGTSAPPMFYSLGYNSGGGNPTHSIVCDVAANPESGDGELYVMWARSSVCMKSGTLCDPLSAGCPRSWLYAELGGSAGFVTTPMLAMADGSNAVIPNGGNTSARTGKDPTLACTYFRSSAQSAPKGYKGTSSLFRWAVVSRSTPQAGNIASANDRQLCGDLYCVWLPASGAWNS